MSTELEPTDSLRAGDIRFAYQRAGLGGLEKLFVDHFMRREKVGLFDANSVSDADIEHYDRAVQRPGALRCPFSCYPPLPRAILDFWR